MSDLVSSQAPPRHGTLSPTVGVDHRTALVQSVWPIFAGALLLEAFHLLGAYRFFGWELGLGSTRAPTPFDLRFDVFWMVFGGGAALLIALGLARFASTSAGTSLRTWWRGSSDTAWMVGGALVALTLPLLLRHFLLRDGPLTDDESSYRFMAQLLASGRVRADSPPLKLFFDRAFMINDGHLYAAYFLGWPALMAPGVWLGAPDKMNALYAALTVPAVFLVLRRLAGSSWARLGLVLFLTAPMLLIGAATELSHTSCVMVLVWLTWFVLRSRDSGAPWTHFAVGLSFSVAFCIRPSSASAIGVPLLGWWLAGLSRSSGRARVRGLVAFAAPALVMAAAFLTVNKVQNGAFTLPSYERVLEYYRENGYRFSGAEWLYDRAGKEHGAPPRPGSRHFELEQPLSMVLATPLLALLRLNFALFGWPCSLLFIPWAGRRNGAGWFWLSLSLFLVVHASLMSVGIDTFGPVHYFETAWPILVLTVLALRQLSQRLARWNDTRVTMRLRSAPVLLPAALAIALVLVSVSGYVPVRLGTIARMAEDINRPRDAVAAAGLHDALVFASRPFAPPCLSFPSHHFVFFRPNNSPDLGDDVLWVNHISVEEDRRLLPYFPKRKGYVMVWTKECVPRLLDIETVSAGTVPNGRIGGTGKTSP